MNIIFNCLPMVVWTTAFIALCYHLVNSKNIYSSVKWKTFIGLGIIVHIVALYYMIKGCITQNSCMTWVAYGIPLMSLHVLLISLYFYYSF